jgi:hypothetical protein
VAAESGGPAAELRALAASARPASSRGFASSQRARYLGTAADLTVAAVLAFGSAAAGSRLLWPVLMIAAYYAAGVLLTGTTPMVALLGEPNAGSDRARAVREPPRLPEPSADDVEAVREPPLQPPGRGQFHSA